MRLVIGRTSKRLYLSVREVRLAMERDDAANFEQHADATNDDASRFTPYGRRHLPRPPPTTTKLTEWVPALAAELGKPPTVVHLWAQQVAGDLGIDWDMTMARADVNMITDLVKSRFG